MCVGGTHGEVVGDVVDSGGTRVAPDAKGTGRGLIGMQERASRLGGSIEVRSAPGEGTYLHIELPLTGEGGTA